MKKILLLLLVCIPLLGYSQTKFRSGVFLHHSTGDNIWGPNGSATSIPIQITGYNTSHGLSGENLVTMDQLWWPTGDNNEWEYWHRIFENKALSTADIRDIISGNKIVVIKSCFPSSGMDSWGHASDSLTPTLKSVYNYKWHWRHIVKAMKKFPDNFFVIWTNAPMTSGQSDANSAALSKLFCTWAKDTLAKGLDPVFGEFPKNVFVFDYFKKLTDNNGYLLNMYAVDPGDSHPNAAATALIAPQFVNEIFNASISYESFYSGVEDNNIDGLSIYPVPALDIFTIKSDNILTDIAVYNMQGIQLINRKVSGNNIEVDMSKFDQGLYMVVVRNNSYKESKKLIMKLGH